MDVCSAIFGKVANFDKFLADYGLTDQIAKVSSPSELQLSPRLGEQSVSINFSCFFL